MTKKPANIAKIAATTFEPKEVAADELEVVAAVEVDDEEAVPEPVVDMLLELEALGVEALEAEALGVDAEAPEPDDVDVAPPEPEELSVYDILKVVVAAPVGVIVVDAKKESEAEHFKKW